MSQFKARLAAVWDNHAPKRYIPRSLNGGTGWEVWDAGNGRWVEKKELLTIPLETIKSEVIA